MVNKLARVVNARYERQRYRMSSPPHIPMPTERFASKLAGWSLVSAAAGFIATFSYLAARFEYPDVLDGAASDVLPKLLQLGSTGRAVWVIYAFLPLLLIPAAIGANRALGNAAPARMQGALVAAVIAAVAMFLGLARWPSVFWELARAFVAGSADAQSAIAAIFDGLNTYLGNYIGEFLGELALNAFFVLSGSALITDGRKVAGRIGIAAGLIGWIAAFRNVTAVVAPIAALDNYVLPLWLIGLGVVLVRHRASDR